MIHSKADLMASEATRKRHADLIASTAFRSLQAVALLEYLTQQSKRADEPGTAYRLQGAREFVDLFLNLSGLPTGNARRDPDNLSPD